MRLTGLAWVVVGAVTTMGCAPFDTVQEACPSQVRGAKLLEPGEAELLRRLGCVRRFVGLPQGMATRSLQVASEGHLAYVVDHGLLDPTHPDHLENVNSPFLQNEALSGATGRDVFDRLEAAEAIIDTTTTGVWQVFWTDDVGPLELTMVHNPYLRDVVFQPDWQGIGIARGNDTADNRITYINLLYAFPPGSRIAKPVVWPRDGQVDVPTSWLSPFGEADPVGGAGARGYPITITVGSFEVSAGANPYDLVIQSAELRGPDGSLALLRAEPGTFPWGNLNGTVIFTPEVQLAPNTTYDFEAMISWVSSQDKVVTTTFTTGDGGFGTDIFTGLDALP